MADGVLKGVKPFVIGRSESLSLNKFFDPSTPSMRECRDGKNRGKSEEEKNNNGKKILTEMLLPFDHLMVTDCKADRSCQDLFTSNLSD